MDSLRRSKFKVHAWNLLDSITMPTISWDIDYCSSSHSQKQCLSPSMGYFSIIHNGAMGFISIWGWNLSHHRRGNLRFSL